MKNDPAHSIRLLQTQLALAFSILLLFYTIVFYPAKVAIAGNAEIYGLKLEARGREQKIDLQSSRFEDSSQMKS